MAEDIILNFGGPAAEPVHSSGPRFDRVTPGTYYVKPELSDGRTSTDKPAAKAVLVISRGPAKGKKVSDMFVLPRAGTDDSTFGQQRLHGLVVSCGIQSLSGKKVKLAGIVNAVNKGRECLAEIADGELPASGQYNARPVSQVVGYYAPGSKEGKKLLSEQKNGTASEDDDAGDVLDEEGEGEEGEEEGEEEGDEAEEEEEAEAPKAKKRSRSKPAPKEEAEEDVDDIFDDE